MPNLKERIEEVVNGFYKNNEDIEKEIKKIVNNYLKNPSKFKDYKEETVDQVFQAAVKKESNSIMENWKKTNQIFNQKIKVIITEEKENIISKLKDKPADYAVRISNAIKYLEIQGDKLNEMIRNEQDPNKTILETADDVVFGILKDFIDDHEQMRLFKQVIKRIMQKDMMENTEGKTMFPKTFGKFNKIEMLINTFNEMETIANVIFLKGKPYTEMYVLNNKRIEIPTKFDHLGYDEDSNDENIVKLAEMIDTAIENMKNSITQ